jgi:excisionase family DNA binding protein
MAAQASTGKMVAGQGSSHCGPGSRQLAVLDLEVLRQDPARLDELPVEELPALLERCAVEHGRVAAVERLAHARLARELPGLTRATEGLLTAAEAAAVLRVPKSYVLELGRRGNLPRITMGKYVRFRPDDVAAYAVAHLDR